MDARNEIINRIIARLGRTAANEEPARASMADYLARKPQGPRPAMPTDLVARFAARSLELSSTVDQVAAMRDAPAAIARYLRDSALPLQAVVWGQLADLPWAEAGLSVEARGALDVDPVGVTACFCAIAETGTLMLCSGAATPAAVSLLPETHVAIVPKWRIVSGMEEAWALARSELGQLPRAVNFVSGPSRTGDIEQTIVLGAHGPYRVHLVLVDAS